MGRNDQKTWPDYVLLTRNSFQINKCSQVESKGIELIFNANNQKKARVAILILEKIEIKTKKKIKERKRLNVIKGSVHQEQIEILMCMH